MCFAVVYACLVYTNLIRQYLRHKIMSGLDNIFGVHEQALLLRAKRSAVIANNIANADTPNFKAKDIDFMSMLNQEMKGAEKMAKTNSKHISVTPSSNDNALMKYRVPTQPSIDGNTVDIDMEKARFAENAVQYQASFTFLNGRIKGLMSAIRGD